MLFFLFDKESRPIINLIERKPYGTKAELGRKIGSPKSQVSELLF